jgi:hypothetical protein
MNVAPDGKPLHDLALDTVVVECAVTLQTCEGRDAYVRWLRARATDLRRMADHMSAEADELERGPSRRSPLGGRELCDAAVARSLSPVERASLAALLRMQAGRMSGSDGQVGSAGNIEALRGERL